MPAKVTATAAPRHSAGQISAESAYTLDYIKEDFGMGVAALRAARRKGLKVRYVGRRGYILGRDLLQYLVDAGK